MTRVRDSVGRRVAMGFALLAGLGLVTGCGKKVKAEFDRPPASASVPETTPDVTEEEPEVQTTAVEEDVVAAEATAPVEEPPSPPRARPRPASPPDPAPPAFIETTAAHRSARLGRNEPRFPASSVAPRISFRFFATVRSPFGSGSKSKRHKPSWRRLGRRLKKETW